MLISDGLFDALRMGNEYKYHVESLGNSLYFSLTKYALIDTLITNYTVTGSLIWPKHL